MPAGLARDEVCDGVWWKHVNLPQRRFRTHIWIPTLGASIRPACRLHWCVLPSIVVNGVMVIRLHRSISSDAKRRASSRDGVFFEQPGAVAAL